jgi:hypothetical protein
VLSLHRLYRGRRPLTVLVILLTVAAFAVAEPVSAAPSAVSSVVSAQSQLAGIGVVSEATIRAAAAADDTMRTTAAVGFNPLGTMPARVQHAAPAPSPVQSAPVQRAATSASSPEPGYGCAAALAYLRANAAPGFTFACPGYAYGNQAMTCVNHAPQCAGEKLIAIAVPCPAAYMNEAHNSWVLTGHGSGIDPYGYCH